MGGSSGLTREHQHEKSASLATEFFQRTQPPPRQDKPETELALQNAREHCSYIHEHQRQDRRRLRTCTGVISFDEYITAATDGSDKSLIYENTQVIFNRLPNEMTEGMWSHPI